MTDRDLNAAIEAALRTDLTANGSDENLCLAVDSWHLCNVDCGNGRMDDVDVAQRFVRMYSEPLGIGVNAEVATDFRAHVAAWRAEPRPFDTALHK